MINCKHFFTIFEIFLTKNDAFPQKRESVGKNFLIISEKGIR